MAPTKLTLTGPLARAARALVEISAKEVADAAGIKKDALRKFERGHESLDHSELRELRAALEGYGAFFVSDGLRGRGHGVRLKFSDEKARRVEGWEDEGGSAAHDDV